MTSKELNNGDLERSNLSNAPEQLGSQSRRNIWFNPGNRKERWGKKQMPNLNRQVTLEKRWGNTQDKQTYLAKVLIEKL